PGGLPPATVEATQRRLLPDNGGQEEEATAQSASGNVRHWRSTGGRGACGGAVVGTTRGTCEGGGKPDRGAEREPGRDSGDAGQSFETTGHRPAQENRSCCQLAE